ncbi:flagellin [Plasticicumulans lactativorans]|uniref:Flagellin n=1 Tax=Plasticicumulans lactativorans TaxID=1133106 RepID=A0A4R2L1Z4_9GAMM|nr:flagellin [Plasticicumulans lactativorans]TCO81071.1 flagellin [Plasticicumulans lactativorans]
MALVINTNVPSLNAQRNLNGTQNALNTSLQRLSSGLRINSAKDDAAGLAISDRMTAQIRGLNQASRNANDGISLAQTAEGALQESTNILQRIRELAVQSANDTNAAADRVSLQKEVAQLQQELNRIANTTSFNGKKVLDGTFTAQQFQVGANANQTIQVNIGDARATAIGAYRVTNGDGAGFINAASTAAATGSVANNVTAGGTITVAGFNGSKDVTFSSGASARDIATAVTAEEASSGVTATAISFAQLTVAASGTVSLDLTGQATGTVTAQIVDVNDLSSLATSINDQAGTTGVFATLSADKTTITLSNADGYDIKVEARTGSQSVGLTGVQEDGTTTSGSAVTVAAGNGSVVGGNLIFQSSKNFSVSSSSTFLYASSAAQAGTLSAVADISINSQAGANDALSVVDSALAYIDDLRADLGAIQNRFQSTIANLQNVSENIAASRSRIQDTDFASETAALSRNQILLQAGTAMLAQANQSQQNVLTLLR